VAGITLSRPCLYDRNPVVFLFPMHNFWALSDPQMKQADVINFLKNMALVGALLMLLAIPQPWPFSLASR
jgi:hypothetical protein